MKLWRYGKDDSLNTTETRGVLAVKLTIGIHVAIAGFALASLIAFLWKGKNVNPGDFWLYVLGMVLSFNAALHGIAWVGGWTKQKEAVKVAEADVIRAGTPPVSTKKITTEEITTPAPPLTPATTANPKSVNAQLTALLNREPSKIDDESTPE